MSAVFNEHQVSLEATGHSVSVPNNSIAKLMYYLNAVNSCLGSSLSEALTDYANHWSLDEAGKAAVVVAAAVLSPDELFKANVFIPVQLGHNALNGRTNEFYKITSVQSVVGVDVDADVIVGGEQRHISDVMLVTDQWLRKHWEVPIAEEAWRARGRELSTTRRLVHPPQQRQQRPERQGQQESAERVSQ